MCAEMLVLTAPKCVFNCVTSPPLSHAIMALIGSFTRRSSADLMPDCKRWNVGEEMVIYHQRAWAGTRCPVRGYHPPESTPHGRGGTSPQVHGNRCPRMNPERTARRTSSRH